MKKKLVIFAVITLVATLVFENTHGRTADPPNILNVMASAAMAVFGGLTLILVAKPAVQGFFEWLKLGLRKSKKENLGEGL